MNKSTLTSRALVISFCRNVKSWKAAYIVQKPQTLGWDCSGSGIAVHFAAWGNCDFHDQESLQNTKIDKVCNLYPMLSLHIAGLRIYNGKSVNVRSWNIVKGKGATVPILE